MKSDEVLVSSNANEDSDKEELKVTNPQLLLSSPAKTGSQVYPVNEDQQKADFCIFIHLYRSSRNKLVEGKNICDCYSTITIRCIISL